MSRAFHDVFLLSLLDSLRLNVTRRIYQNHMNGSLTCCLCFPGSTIRGDAAEPSGFPLLSLQIDQTGNHDSLRLRGAGAVHRLREVSHGSRSQGDVFDQPQYAHSVLHGDAFDAPEYFSIHFPTSGERRSASEGKVTISPPAMSWARRATS